MINVACRRILIRLQWPVTRFPAIGPGSGRLPSPNVVGYIPLNPFESDLGVQEDILMSKPQRHKKSLADKDTIAEPRDSPGFSRETGVDIAHWLRPIICPA